MKASQSSTNGAAPGLTEGEHTTEITLKGVAKRARAEHEKCIKAGRKQINHAANAGNALIDLKEKVKHGDWEIYVEQIVGIKKDTARTYMSLALHRQIWQAKDGSINASVHHLAGESLRKIADHCRRKAKGKSDQKKETRSPFEQHKDQFNDFWSGKANRDGLRNSHRGFYDSAQEWLNEQDHLNLVRHIITEVIEAEWDKDHKCLERIEKALDKWDD